MTSIKYIKRKISELSPDELAKFRSWYSDFDADIWDRQIAKDVEEGRLDALVAAAPSMFTRAKRI